jgi:Protein of unknown function (DUF2281)
MTVTQELISIVEQLPEPSVQEVLHFAEFLRERISRTTTALESNKAHEPSALLQAARLVIAEEQSLLQRLGD